SHACNVCRLARLGYSSVLTMSSRCGRGVWPTTGGPVGSWAVGNSTIVLFVVLVVAIVVLGSLLALVVARRAKTLSPPPRTEEPAEPALPEPSKTAEPAPGESEPEFGSDVLAPERPEPAAGRMVRLRARLARSQSSLGRGLLALLGQDRLDEDAWDEIEDTLLAADVGVQPAQELIDRLRTRIRVEGV